MNPALADMLTAALTNHKSGNHSTALMQYRIILKHFGDSSLAWEGYSALLRDLGRHEDCIGASRRALEIDPSNKAALSNLRAALNDLMVAAAKSGNPMGLSALADQVAEYLGDDPVDRAFVLSHIKLLLGEFETGWCLFEKRLEHPSFLGARRLLRYPKWDGKPYRRQTLLLHGEQGFGDSIMMMRYLGMAKSLGGTLALYMPKELADLARACPGPDMVIGEASENVSFNFQLPLMSLPYIFNTNLETIPNKAPYISPPGHVPNKEAIDAKLADGKHSKRIGIAWAGRPTHKRDSERSMPPGLLAPLQAAPSASWFCLQRDAPDTAPFPGAIPLGGLFDTFVDTAYAVGRMDEIVTVDTAIAHLAGAMGVRVKLMVTCLPEWRWLLWRSDSPWYPTMKIYRQPSPGDWQSAIQRVLADLTAGN